MPASCLHMEEDASPTADRVAGQPPANPRGGLPPGVVAVGTPPLGAGISSAGGWPGPGCLGSAAGSFDLEPGVKALSVLENQESPAMLGLWPPDFNSPWARLYHWELGKLCPSTAPAACASGTMPRVKFASTMR